jgi:hypothetical protein
MFAGPFSRAMLLSREMRKGHQAIKAYASAVGSKP